MQRGYLGDVYDFFSTYECFTDLKDQAQSYFANMTDEEIANEAPEGVKIICRYHDVPNGTGFAVVEAEDQEAMTQWTMGWASLCHFPIVKPVVDDQTARRLIKQMEAS